MLDLHASREAIVREWDLFFNRLQDVSGTSWEDTPVRCEGWNLPDLVAHVAWGMSMEADALSRMLAGVSDPAQGEVHDPHAKSGTLMQAGIAARDQLYKQLKQLTIEDMSKAAPMPYGPIPAPFTLQVFVMEAGVHGNDLADALGQPERLPEDVILATATVLAGSLPLLAQASQEVPTDCMTYRLKGNKVSMDLAYEEGGWVVSPIEPEPDCEIRSSDSDLILFAMGRIPVDDERLTIMGERSMATKFKAHFPGP